MYTKDDLIEDLKKLRINPKGTLMVHSSYKAIGEVEGRADTVLDALMEYMEDGLLTLPTHTWRDINPSNPVFNVLVTPSHVGILTELFRKREGVLRSAHPTHSVAAYGKDAKDFTTGDERFDTPCARGSAWGKLLDREAQILLIGVDLRRNTYIHGVEEWLDIPGRLTDTHQPLKSVLADGTVVDVPSRRHHGDSWSEYFWKVEEILVNQKAMIIGWFGDAVARVCDAKRIYNVLAVMLQDMPDLFSDNEPLSREQIDYYSKLDI